MSKSIYSISVGSQFQASRGLIIKHQVITTIVLLKFTKQRAWATMEITLWVKLRMWTCSLGFYGPSARTTPSFHHACLVRTSSSVERPMPSSLHLFFKPLAQREDKSHHPRRLLTKQGTKASKQSNVSLVTQRGNGKTICPESLTNTPLCHTSQSRITFENEWKRPWKDISQRGITHVIWLNPGTTNKWHRHRGRITSSTDADVFQEKSSLPVPSLRFFLANTMLLAFRMASQMCCKHTVWCG